jgi:hypothetical protein
MIIMRKDKLYEKPMEYSDLFKSIYKILPLLYEIEDFETMLIVASKEHSIDNFSIYVFEKKNISEEDIIFCIKIKRRNEYTKEECVLDKIELSINNRNQSNIDKIIDHIKKILKKYK